MTIARGVRAQIYLNKGFIKADKGFIIVKNIIGCLEWNLSRSEHRYSLFQPQLVIEHTTWGNMHQD